MIKEFSIQTSKKQEIINITKEIKEITNSLNFDNGICVVYAPHSTAGILINENYDENVCKDIINKLEKLIPEKGNYKHDCIDKNAHSHIKSSIIGPSETIIIQNKKLLLGTWQKIALAEFDGPRKRKIFLKFIKNGR
jgi:secondary thiamine-phosphate synthase enzyme